MDLPTIEKRGKSVDEAIKAALDELECGIENAVIEVVEEPSKSLLGLIKKPAIVKVSIREKPDEKTLRIVEGLLNRMKIDYEIEKVEQVGSNVRVNITGKDMGLLIGYRGETLNAVQLMTNLIVNRNTEERVKVTVDVEDYRKKREQSLKSLAIRLSNKVKKTRKNVIMRPMNSQERRIIHTTLQGDPQISTYSTGDEPNRKVVIALKNNK